MLRVSIAGLCLLVFGGMACASFTGYDPVSENEMPGAGWVLDPSYQAGENPIRRQVPAGSGIVVSADGIAHIDCNNTTTSRWDYNGTGFDSSVGFTVDFSIKDMLSSPTNTGCSFRISEDDHFAVIIKVLGEVDGDESLSRLELAWSDGDNVYTSSVSDRVDLDYFHVWRFVCQDDNFAIYVDDQAESILSGTVTQADRDLTYVSFGDWGSSTNGNADLDYVVWDNTQAIFAAPIPEPFTISIILAGGIFAASKRRNCA